MASDVTMPRLSDSMEEGTVLKWLVDEGAEVKRGEPLVEIETDKANMTYDADADGTLIEIVAQEGDTLAIGEVIARIGEAGDATGNGKPAAEEKTEDEERPQDEDEAGEKTTAEDEEPAEAGASAEADADEAEAETADAGEARGGGGGADGGGETQAAAKPSDGGDGGGTATRERAPSGDGNGGERVKASPVARRMARELGLELGGIDGTGPGGRIVKADVQAAAEDGGAKTEEAPAEAGETKAEPAVREEEPAETGRAEAGPKGQAEIQELTRLQQTVSRRMAESKATAPDFSISLTVDMTQAVELRKRLKEVADPAPSFNDMVVKAAATALTEHPRVNGAYRDGKFELYDNVNIGVAVAAQDALVVPTVFNADQKSLGQISKDARAVIEKVRDKTVTPPELSGGTFTVSNLGMFGIEFFTAIINPPQASILTVGKLEKRPAVDDGGRIVAQDQMTLSLVCDHRILYGADGAKFLARVKELLERPLSLAL
jgi:pyruvate dehydrogenase E2 component (dihydrolipoamide acetyltransferase)